MDTIEIKLYLRGTFLGCWILLMLSPVTQAQPGITSVGDGHYRVSFQPEDQPGEEPADEPVLPPTVVEEEEDQPEAPEPLDPTPPPPPPEPQAPVELPPPGGTDFQRALESAGTQTIISLDRLQRNVPNSLSDVLRYEPGVRVQSSIGRFGETSINIRGLEGNRVLIQVDGIRSADSFQQGPVQLGRGAIEPILLKQVDIYRGAGSIIYGEGALAGAVILETKDPEDFLSQFDRDQYFGITGGYYDADSSTSGTPIIAARWGNLDAMVAYTRRDGIDLESRGAFPSDPQDYNTDYMLGKLVYHFNDYNELEFAAEWYDEFVTTNLNSTLANPPVAFNFNTFTTTPEAFPGGLPAARTFSVADDNNRRLRYSLTHDYTNPDGAFVKSARFQVYYQKSEINDNRLQRFLATEFPMFGPPQTFDISNPADNIFTQHNFGTRAIFNAFYEAESATHDLTYGMDYLRVSTARLRTGSVDNLTTGMSINTNQIGEPTPLKVLPDVATDRLGFFLRDRIQLTGTDWAITPGVRVNYYNADFELPDPQFDDSNGTPNDIAEWSAQPTIEVSRRLTDEWLMISRYSRGYRAPPVEDAGIGFTNTVFGYTVLPNTNLDSETSDGVDLGFSYSDDWIAGYVGGYYTLYNGFIENVTVGFDPNLNLLVFQQRNLDAQIYGVEMGTEIRLWGDLNQNGFAGWSLFGNFTHSIGDNLEDGIPLDSIPPTFAIAGLRYAAEDDAFGMEFISTLVSRKNRSSGTIADQFVTPGFATFDLLAWAQVNEHIRVNTAIYNLFNTEYYDWLNLRGVTRDQTDLTRFAAPGITFAGTITAEW